MFSHIKNSVLNDVLYDPALEHAAMDGITNHDKIRDFFVDSSNDIDDKSIPSVPDSIFDDDEFDEKLDELIKAIPEDDSIEDFMDDEDPEDEFGHY